LEIYVDKVYFNRYDLHKFTTKIVREFDEIFVGDLNHKFQAKNKHLAKDSHDLHQYEIRRQLEYKSKWYCKEFKIVDESYTSKTCNVCGHRKEDLKLSTRE
jgi:putative transposase